MQGNLTDMAVADLIQLNCQGRKTARLTLKHKGRQAVLFFKDGAVPHATLGDVQGEQVIYSVLDWVEGHFNLEAGFEPPDITINRSWAALLVEGARRLDETGIAGQASETLSNKNINLAIEENPMAKKIDSVLKELGNEVDGFVAAGVVGMDGLGIAQYAISKNMDMDKINAQMTLLIKLIDTTTTKLGVGKVENNLLATENAYLLIRFLDDKSYYLGIAANRRVAKLGNMRLISRVYAKHISAVMPH